MNFKVKVMKKNTNIILKKYGKNINYFNFRVYLICFYKM